MIVFEEVTKSFADTIILNNISLCIAKGQTTVLLGSSGCGKSTMLRLILGLIAPEKGHVRFANELVINQTLKSIRHRTGYVLQDGGLFPHLTAIQNVSLLARHLDWHEEKIKLRVQELAQLVALEEDQLLRYPSELSGGQRQRVGLMRALMLDPDVLLLDEPLGALDPITRSDLQRELAEIFKRLKKTVLLVTHDLAEADFLGDHIVLMNQGCILQQGNLNEMLKDPADPFVTRFIQAQNINRNGK